MKQFLIAFAGVLAFSVAQATPLDTAYGSINFEYETGHPHPSGPTGTSLQVAPAINFTKDNRLIGLDRVELLVEGEQDNAFSSGPSGSSTYTKMGVRVRRNFDIGYGFSGYLRSAVGRTMSNESNLNWAYYEPGAKYKFNDDWSFTASYRIVRAIDGQSNISGVSTSINKLRIGPNYEITKRDNVELRYVREFNAGSNSFLNWTTNGYQANAYVLEYSHKF